MQTSTSDTPGAAVQIRTKSPSVFSAGAVLVICAYGLLLVIPVLLTMLVVSVLQLGIWTLLIPLATICAVTYFLPFGFGNHYVTRLVRTLESLGNPGGDAFIVQITFNPRSRSGLRALIEDADDIGRLTVSQSGVWFQGDSMELYIPRQCITSLQAQSIGLRGLFVYPRVTVAVSGLHPVKELRLADRSCWVLPTAHRRTRKLYECLSRLK